ncbi:MAG TPA: efflux RND transporter permease subunit, partial [Kaistiaceae bacterium]|nr:efflux RND transporter permease subunit [Kaistiaceae bacterium]
AVGRVRGKLPDDADEPQVVKSDSDADPVMRLAVTSSRMTAAEITDYVERFVLDRLSTLPGVASINVYGARRFAVRIWIDRAALAARNLTVADVEDALRRNNVELPAGDIESTDRQMTVRLDSRVSTIDQFSRLVIDRVAGYPIRLGDVATVEAGVEDDSTVVRSNGRQAIGLAVLRQSQANTLAISNAVRAEIDKMQPGLPAGMAIEVGSDDALFVAASIREVAIALGLSIVLVVVVILVFLMSARATLVPAITIPVSLIGCFPLIWGLGFSINVLTLLALLLAIGIVVDDAIVVLENIQRRYDRGESRLVAASRGARQVTFAVLATSLTLIAVFVPLSFLEGQVGRLFIEFGFVMASAVAISTFVALSACPALASKILAKHPPKKDGDAEALGAVGRAYKGALGVALKMPLVVILVSAAVAAGSYAVYEALPRELTPSEDRGVVFIPVTAPQGATLAYTDAEAKKVESFAEPLRDDGLLVTIFSFTGWGNRPYRSFVVLRMAPWEDRDEDQRAVVRFLAPKMGELTGARGFPVTPAGLGLRGSSTPLRVVIGGPDFDSIKEWAAILLARAEENPGLKNVEIDYEESQPQLSLAIDRARADDLGIGIQSIATTLQTMLASREVTNYIDRGREY